MSYMELGESHAWQKSATGVVVADGDGDGNGNGNAAVDGKSVGAGGNAGGSGSGRIANARPVVGTARANVQSHGSSVYEDDFSGAFR